MTTPNSNQTATPIAGPVTADRSSRSVPGELGWILRNADGHCISAQMSEPVARELARRCNGYEAMREALKPVADEIHEKVGDPFHDTWNPDAHADDITLTIAECRNILSALKEKP